MYERACSVFGKRAFGFRKSDDILLSMAIRQVRAMRDYLSQQWVNNACIVRLIPKYPCLSSHLTRNCCTSCLHTTAVLPARAWVLSSMLRSAFLLQHPKPEALLVWIMAEYSELPKLQGRKSPLLKKVRIFFHCLIANFKVACRCVHDNSLPPRGFVLPHLGRTRRRSVQDTG